MSISGFRDQWVEGSVPGSRGGGTWLPLPRVSYQSNPDQHSKLKIKVGSYFENFFLVTIRQVALCVRPYVRSIWELLAKRLSLHGALVTFLFQWIGSLYFPLKLVEFYNTKEKSCLVILSICFFFQVLRTC